VASPAFVYGSRDVDLTVGNLKDPRFLRSVIVRKQWVVHRRRS